MHLRHSYKGVVEVVGRRQAQGFILRCKAKLRVTESEAARADTEGSITEDIGGPTRVELGMARNLTQRTEQDDSGVDIGFGLSKGVSGLVERILDPNSNGTDMASPQLCDC